ncbi:MAG: O-antigen ligase family protein [Acidobacteriota bacterium]
MAKKGKARPATGAGNPRTKSPTNAPRPPAAAAEARDFPAAVAAVLLAAAFAAAALAVDVSADAAFDAPKRLLSLFAIGAACLAAFGFAGWENPAAGGRLAGWKDRRLPALLAAFALLAAVLSAAASPRHALAVDSLRPLLVMAALLPLGASRVFSRHRGALAAAFLAICGVDAAISLLQARQLLTLFPLLTQGDREATGALAGNTGYLALGLALATVVALGGALTARRRAVRIGAVGSLILFSGALLANRNLTSFSALGAGAAVLLFGLFGRRALLPLAAAILLLVGGVVLYRPMRERAAAAAASARSGDWDVLLSYRLAPWNAAARMARERPLLGYGPGTFGSEYVTHRLDAEIAARKRFVSPLATSTYGEAHCDYLQPFAEAGFPSGLAALGAAAFLMAAVARKVRASPPGQREEALILLAILAAGAVAALTWFPLQRPITAIPLLLAAGRSWRVAFSGGAS